MNINNLLLHIRKELRYLEENGIYVEGIGTVKATIVCTTHDNLAAHLLFCMVLGFNAKYFCRFCKITLQESLHTTQPIPELIRENILEEIVNVMGDDNYVTDPHQSFGFKKISELHHLKYFKIETGSCVDPFHDLLEGIVPRDIKFILDFMIKEMKISMNDIQDYVNMFKFGILNSSHKPSNIQIKKDSNSIGLSGMQCRTFIINFIFIFGHLFTTPDELKILAFVENLIKIVQIAFKSELEEKEVNELEKCIKKYLEDLVLIFPSARYSRKHHFLVHYPEVIRRLGPTALMSTAPFENKHVFFTRHVRTISVNKNIIKTLATRHQFILAQKLKFNLGHKIFVGKVTTASKEVSTLWKQKLKTMDAIVEQISWVKFGFKYASSYFFYYKDAHLIEIDHIVRISDKIFIKGKQYEISPDPSGYSFKLHGILSNVYLSFEKIKLQPTFNKVLSSFDKLYHVTIV